MERIQEFLRTLYRRKIKQEFDALILVVGDEGVGKSTYMVESTGRWQQILADEGYLDDDKAGSVDEVLSRLVWNQDGFKQALAENPPRSAIPVMDAARVLHKKKAMHSEQIEVEMDLLDSRMKEQVVFLGYQDWETIPDMLQRRRAKYCLRIPYRGRIEGYSRESMNALYASNDNEWPEPDLVDSFPDLSGTEIWEEFKRRDREHKEKRIRPEEESEEDELEPVEIVEKIKESGVVEYIVENEFNGHIGVKKEYIKLDYPHLSDRAADVVKSGLERDCNVEQLYHEANGGKLGGVGGEAHT